MKKIMALWVCALLMFSSVFVMLEIPEDAEGKEVVKDGVNLHFQAPITPNIILTPNVMVNDAASTSLKISIDIASLDSGRDLVVWAEKRFGDYDVLISFTSNNGTTFSPDMIVNKNQTGNQTGPSIATSPNDEVYVVWRDDRLGNHRIHIAKSTDKGDNFNTGKPVSNRSYAVENYPDVAVNNQTVAVVWQDSGSDNRIRIWNSTTGQLFQTLEGHAAAVRGIDFSPDGTKMISVAEDDLVKVWDTSTWTTIDNLTAHTNFVTSVDWSKDGAQFATGSWDNITKIWNASTHTVIDVLDQINGTLVANPVNDINFSPDGTHIAVVYNGIEIREPPIGIPNNYFNVTIWNLTTGYNFTTNEKSGGGHNKPVTAVAYSPNGTLVASGANDGKVKIWNSTTGILEKEFTGLGEMNDIAWSSDGQFIAAGLDNDTIVVFNYSNFADKYWLVGHKGNVNAISWHYGNDAIASGASDPKAFSWDLAIKTTNQTFPNHQNSVYAIDWSPSGAQIATGGGNSIMRGGAESQIYCAVSVDGGSTFSEAVSVAETLEGQKASADVAMDSNNVISVAWYDDRTGIDGVYFSNSTDLGVSFSDDVPISVSTSKVENLPAITVEKDTGTVHMAWQKQTGGDTYNPIHDIHYANSSDSFSNVVIIDPNIGVQQSPDITVTPDGSNIFITWIDTREGGYQVFLTNSSDGGLNFDNYTVVNDEFTYSKWTPAIATDKYSQTSIAWNDYRNGHSDIYFATTLLVATVPSAPQDLQATAGDGQVVLDWSAPSFDGGSVITNYKIYRGTTSGGEIYLTTVGNVLTYTDTSVTNGQIYHYKVSAVNDVGEGPQSNEASAKPIAGGLITRLPIRINSNADFDAAHGVTGGSGTEADPWIIEKYDIDGTGYGYCIYIGNTTDYFVVRDCNLKNANESYLYYSNSGIILYNVTNGSICNNTLLKNENGIELYKSTNNLITNNYISGLIYDWNGDGWANGVHLYNSNNNQVTQNTIIYHALGIVISTHLGLSENNTIDNNHIQNGFWGFQLAGNFNILTNNTIMDFDIGIASFSSQNIIYSNNFINNVQQASDSGSNFWDNGYPSGGNYWSDYTGIDDFSGSNQDQPGSDGIGDTNYTIGGSNVDNYPLMEAWPSPAMIPSSPQNLQATPGDGQVVLDWSAPASDGGSTITNYKIYRGTTSGGEVYLTTVGNVLTYTDSTVTNGQTYYYQVSAVNGVDEGVKSNEVSTTPQAIVVIPDKPILSDPGSIDDDGAYTVFWSSSSGAELYILQEKEGSNPYSTIYTGVSTSKSISGKTDGIYYYRVRATNSAGDSEWSNVESITVEIDSDGDDISDADEELLAQTYLPTFYFDNGLLKDEKCFPTTIDYHLDNKINQTSGGSVYYDNERGTVLDSGVEDDYYSVSPKTVTDSEYPYTTYVRVTTDSYDLDGDGTEGDYVVIQYWLFYAFNDGVNNHEGDWEMVQIILDTDYNPLYAAYSQHYNGEIMPWNLVEKTIDHPTVYVARGSHASYFDDGPHLGGLDWTSTDVQIYYNELEYIVLGEKTEHQPSQNWLNDPAYWGEHSNIPFWSGPPGPLYREAIKLKNINMWEEPLRWSSELSDPNNIAILLECPTNMTIIDQYERKLGYVNGELINEIPGAHIFMVGEVEAYTVPPNLTYTFLTRGYEDGSYNLTIVNGTTQFNATEIPLNESALHKFEIDWEKIHAGEDGITINIDLDGDGNWDYNLTSDSNFTKEEYITGIEPENIDIPSINSWTHYSYILVITVILVLLAGIMAWRRKEEPSLQEDSDFEDLEEKDISSEVNLIKEPPPESELETELCSRCGFGIEKGGSCPFCEDEEIIEEKPESLKPKSVERTKSQTPALSNEEILARIEKAYEEGKMSEDQYLKNLEKFQK